MSKSTVLITGANKGIGYACAKKFLENGYNVIIAGRSESRLKVAAAKLNNCAYIVWDIADVSVADDRVKEAHKFYGNIDIFVNCAGIVTNEDWDHVGFLNTTVENWDMTMDINFRGTYFACQAQARYMVENNIKGHIVIICSEMGFRAVDYPYGLSKWGIRGLTLGMASSMAKHGIVVNAVAPGETSTEILRQVEGELHELDGPRGIRAMPSEMANAVYFLATEDNTIGTILLSDGGRSLH